MQVFIQEWWPLIVPAVLIAAKIANKVTKHWPQWSPYLRWLGFLVEVLDLVRIPEVRDVTSKEGRVYPATDTTLEKGAGDTSAHKDTP